MSLASSTSPFVATVVIGAGAAGLMAAIHAASGARPVLLLEGSQRPGQKILISGGGRCNVLPAHAEAADFISDSSPYLVRNILAAWPLAAVRRFFEADLGVSLKLEPETGKLFPVSDRARTVLDALLAAAAQRGVRLQTGARVTALTREGEIWRVRLANDTVIPAGRVILATGGLSVPATGSDGSGLRLAQALGHTLAPTYPALVPLIGEHPKHRALAGLSVSVTLWAETAMSARTGEPARYRRSAIIQTHGGFLFTHRGYSGPAVLNISHVATRALQAGTGRPAIFVQWTDLDAQAWERLLAANRRPLLPLLRDFLPERLAAQLLAEAGLTAVDAGQLRREERQCLVRLLARYPLPYTGHEGYRTAEVTGGGIPLHEVAPATLESRLVPGLYLCGEMLDAFGPIGGYNFLWAWVTGFVAGCAARA